MPEPDYGVSLSAPTTSINPKPKTSSASVPKEKSFFEKLKDSVTGPPTAAAQAAADAFHANVGNSDDGPSAMQGGIASLSGATADADMYAENLKRYNDYINSQRQPAPTEITPEMRQAALSQFESQQGAGQVPYYMAAARNRYPQYGQNERYEPYGSRYGQGYGQQYGQQYGSPYGQQYGSPYGQQYGQGYAAPNMSPAFMHASQNYDILGGSQRLAPRPMEMMSSSERTQINDMSQAMADQQMADQQNANPVFSDATGNELMAALRGKGGGKGASQNAPQSYGPQYGSPSGQGQAPLGAILASRFGGFGF
jgi:hypothetical protein